jgi:hypothetical protein
VPTCSASRRLPPGVDVLGAPCFLTLASWDLFRAGSAHMAGAGNILRGGLSCGIVQLHFMSSGILADLKALVVQRPGLLDNVFAEPSD